MKKNNRQVFPENQIGQDAKEKLRLENEILRLKLKAECGSEFHHSDNIPPEIEHQFLKNILAFEESYASAKLTSIFDFLGQPAVKRAEEINDHHIEEALEKLTGLLSAKNLTIDFGKVTDARIKYTFITGEFFRHQINDIRLPGMFLHFLYEEFYPDHESDIRKRALEFLSEWFERTTGKFSWELANTFILPDGTTLPKKEVLKKFRQIFDCYTAFRDCRCIIDDVRFELKEDGLSGLGHVDGRVKYIADLESGDIFFINGTFKLFLTLEDGCWRIFYFMFPGFEW